MNIQQMYNNFLEKGELQTLMPTSTGIWEKDKAEFREVYTLLYESVIEDNNEEEYEED